MWRLCIALACVPAMAQWTGIRTPNVPRLANGQPNLTAPAPKMPDGKPDLSGIWNPRGRLSSQPRAEPEGR